MRKKIGLLLIAILTCFISLNGQVEEEYYENDYPEDEYYEGEYYEEEASDEELEREKKDPIFLVDMNFLVGVPTTDFRKKNSDNSFGGGGTFLVRLSKQMPIYAGLSISGMIFDQEREDFLLTLDGVTSDARFSVRNSIFMMHACLRMAPPVDFFVKPYFEGKAGFKNLYTRYVIRDLEYDEEIESEVLDGDWAFSYGGRMGLLFPVFDDEEGSLHIDLSASYLRGTAADFYIRDNSIELDWENPLQSYEERNSTTDLMVFRIGMAVVF